MRTIFYSVKGGQGTSVASVAAAVTLGRTQPVDLIGHGPDHRNILGLPGRFHADDHGRNEPEELAWRGVTLWDTAGPEVARPERRQVLDAGCRPDPGVIHDGDEVILVLRNDYLALSAAVQHPIRPTGILLVEEFGRALTRSDVSNVLGSTIPMHAIAIDTTVARAVDAGLFADRVPAPLSRALEALVIQFIPEAQEGLTMPYVITRPIMTAAELATHKIGRHGRDYRLSDDGYSDMEVNSKRGWRSLGSWGADGWDLGEWPYVVISIRERDGRFDLLQVVEGDHDIYSFATREDRDAAIDYLFLWYAAGKNTEPSIGADKRELLDTGHVGLRIDDRFRGPFRTT